MPAASGPRGKRSARKDAKSAEVVTTDDDDDDRGGQTTADEAVPPAPSARPRPRPIRSGLRSADLDIEAPAASDNDDPFSPSIPLGVPHASTPKPDGFKPRRSSRSGSPSEATRTRSSSLSNVEIPLDIDSPNGYPIPTPTHRKRGRSRDAEDQDDEMSVATISRHTTPGAALPSAPLSASQETQATEIHIRRKRIRH